jgi:hypothetical protein
MSLATVVQTALSNLQQDPQTAELFIIINSLGPALVYGEAVREFYYSATPTSMRIVIDCPASALVAFSTYGGTLLNQNNVTGYQFTVSGIEYFITNLDAVWAVIQSNNFVAELTLDIIPSTVFFNLNAVGYRLDTGVIDDGGFGACIASKQLDIVYGNTLQPLAVAAEAMFLLAKYSLGPSFALQAFIQTQIQLGLDVIYFSKYQTATYGGVIYQYDSVIKLIG